MTGSGHEDQIAAVHCTKDTSSVRHGFGGGIVVAHNHNHGFDAMARCKRAISLDAEQ
ncbi:MULTISPECIES: hypothetical protein [unclassified Thalassospira]|uniref:hypothetical protein n=1 Tax=unclassified Thalassospira TaxID=2648997 RepID=UPI0018CF310A|nr:MULTISPECIES: hypothetical protein [unclassified Thalassospira]QPO10339.1 hypothetical protein IT893_11135 [Thalassospira sp. A40-3]